ncbi:glucose-6-phosphate dehydrogenase [Streptomyces triticirhizae]|uniref:Glucose-6-phosphate 1-dehydrogenase n=1 Tax=Streptomyces triticirhizae TaxID=2483353 RepID=A0A3M2LKI4_9ACTN|nr:glucose-6-phosphate dehydrogenase [Streptomyces triticirhizae]RMI37616.1 glucose-6-phosphate dehydrogenase [Streptomyces triticirhizae]
MNAADHPAPAEAPADPQVLVIFGATGDLARRNLFPGLFRLYAAGLLPEDFRVIGSGRHAPGSDEEFRDQLGEAVREFAGEVFDERRWKAFAARLGFVASSTDDGAELAAAVDRARRDTGGGERARLLLYLSVPPSIAGAMVEMVGATGLADDATLVMEKPFGTDLASARALDATIAGVVPEERVFRIDHFLGLEAVRTLLALRFGNGIFESFWNREHIASVVIDVPEDLGLEGRAGFMESTGTFRDMVTTHLCQILGVVALEPPARLTADALRAEKLRVFRALRPFDPAETVFGQFDGYRAEEGVAEDSTVETFVALRARVDNRRWRGVPFLLRTGKAMGSSQRLLTVTFREPPLDLFDADDLDDGDLDDGNGARLPDALTLELSDHPLVRLRLAARRPGAQPRLGRGDFTFRPAEFFAEDEPLEAYTRLLLDALRGDQTLFTGSDEVERLWEVCEPVLRDPPDPLPYARGSWGPEAALRLADPHGWAVPEA